LKKRPSVLDTLLRAHAAGKPRAVAGKPARAAFILGGVKYVAGQQPVRVCPARRLNA